MFLRGEETFDWRKWTKGGSASPLVCTSLACIGVLPGLFKLSGAGAVGATAA